MSEADASLVWFYLHSRPGENARLSAACRIADKAYSSGRRVLACAADVELAREFDRLLWTFRQDSFVPHALGADADERDIVSIDSLDGPAATAAAAGAAVDVLLMLDDSAPEWGLRAQRVAAVVGGDDAGRAAGRVAFKRWQALGVRPHTVELRG